jgi:hypothetical protein
MMPLFMDIVIKTIGTGSMATSSVNGIFPSSFGRIKTATAGKKLEILDYSNQRQNLLIS